MSSIAALEVNQSRVPLHIEQIPNNVLGIIFRYLSLPNQVNAQKTCKRWNELLRNKSTREHFQLDSCWKDKDVPVYILSMFPEFKELAKRISRVQICDNIVSTGEYGAINSTVEAVARMLSSFRDSLCPVSQVDVDRVNEIWPESPVTIKEIEANRTALLKAIPRILQIVILVYTAYRLIDAMRNSFQKARQRSQEELLNALRLPQELTQDPVLNQYICPISRRIPLIPVIDKCNHLFDYLYISDHINRTIQCPITQEHVAQEDIQFDLNVFMNIQRRLSGLRSNGDPLVKNLKFKIFNLPWK